MPEALLATRTPAVFARRAAARVPDAVVAARAGSVVGFAVALPATGELEQLFVDAAARGTGVAATLLRAAEARLPKRGRWHLVTTVGNAAAAAFYAKHGWARAGTATYAADLGGGRTLDVALDRFEKDAPPGDASYE